MQHCDEEALALLALGEPAAGPADEAHLASCSRCQSDLDQLKAVVHASRQVTPEDSPVQPGPHVWARIAAELELGSSGPDSAPPPVPPELAKRRRVVPLAVAAALVGILAGVLGTVVVKDHRSSVAAGNVVAETRLAPLDAPQASGTATVRDATSGRTLSVTVHGLVAPADAFYQVWLADRQTQKMVAVGILDSADQGTFDVPPGMDLAQFPVVDVSLEPMDGNPAHSSVSVVRGTLPG